MVTLVDTISSAEMKRSWENECSMIEPDEVRTLTERFDRNREFYMSGARDFNWLWTNVHTVRFDR